eukprot:1917522-Karenia_brevis.AAC.1
MIEEADADADMAVMPGENANLPKAEQTPTASRLAVRPIQMGEFLRKWATRRLLAIQQVPIQCAMIAARQWG